MKISVIITTYNVAEYIAVAIQSVLDCDFEDLELIVVDDFSRDGTRDIVRMFSRAHPELNLRPVLFPRNTPGGVATAGNAGLDLATGDVVIFVDGDDWVIPASLRVAVQKLDDNPRADFVVCDCAEYWNENGRYSRYPEWSEWEAIDRHPSPEKQLDLLLKMAPFPWRKVYRRSFLEENSIRFPVGDFFFEDNPLHWETTTRAKGIVFHREVTHVHRMGRQGQTVGTAGLKFMKIFDHAVIIRDGLVARGQLEHHRRNYLAWLAKHVLWAARAVPASALNSVFNLACPILQEMPENMLWDFLEDSGYNASDTRKLAALRLGDRLGFLREY